MSKNKQLDYIIGEDTITVMYEGKPYMIHSDDEYRFNRAKEAIVDSDWDAVVRVFDIKIAIADFSHGDITVKGGEVFYKGKEKLHGVVVEKLLDLLGMGLQDAAPLVNYIANLLNNPSKQSVDELYDFLSYRSLPIDSDGFVLAYKGVRDNYWSVRGNRNTVVLQGETNDKGQILNNIGDTIEVQRRCVDDNRANNCSDGLHVGSFDYASDWGQRTLQVRFNPADAVSVPLDCSCQKCRVTKYQIVKEIEREETRAYVNLDEDEPDWGDKDSEVFVSVLDAINGTDEELTPEQEEVLDKIRARFDLD